MKLLTRRSFLRFAPTEAGAIALGVAVFPEIVRKLRSLQFLNLPDTNTSQAISETILVAAERAADPPLVEHNLFSGALVYRDIEKAP